MSTLATWARSATPFFAEFETLLREIVAYFHRSSKRIEDLADWQRKLYDKANKLLSDGVSP